MKCMSCLGVVVRLNSFRGFNLAHNSHADWVERRKRKKVILQDFMALNPDLKFTDEGGDVIDDVWRQWK